MGCIEVYNKRPDFEYSKLPKVECYVADDMISTFKKFVETDEQKAQLENYSESIEESNGQTIFTKDNKKIVIIVNASQFNRNDDFIHTIIHEYTHALDYYNYMEEHGMQNFDVFLENKNFNAFYLWTEYHARFIGTEVYYSYILDSFDIDLEQQLEYKFKELTNQLIQFQQNKRNPDLAPEGTFLQVMYDVTQHLARFSVYKNYKINALTCSGFPMREITFLLGEDILQYYKFLMNNSTYKKIRDNLFELCNIVESIYKYTWEH